MKSIDYGRFLSGCPQKIRLSTAIWHAGSGATDTSRSCSDGAVRWSSIIVGILTRRVEFFLDWRVCIAAYSTVAVIRPLSCMAF